MSQSPQPSPKNTAESANLSTTSKRIIRKIKGNGYIGFIKNVPSDDRHISYVHIASFQHPETGPCEAYVKLYPNNSDKELANEITAFLCAHALNIPQPAQAFIANIPIERLRSPPAWVKTLSKTQKTLPAFCTTRLDGESAAVRVPESEIKLVIDDVAQWPHLEKAVVLDENIANTDRHLNNLIRLSRKRFAIIDGGRLASGANGEYWTAHTLSALSLYRNRLSEHIWNHRPEQKSVDKMMFSAPSHAGSIDQIFDELRYWWANLLTLEEAKAFDNFLFMRTAQVEHLLRERYRILI
jgi:hypothetical protein